MTTVSIRKTAEGRYTGFTCIGHAGYAKRGEDIVCASISVLVINTVNSLEEMLKEPVKIVTGEAAGLIDCRFEKEPSGKAIVLMDSLVFGLKALQKEYGKKYLELKFEEV